MHIFKCICIYIYVHKGTPYVHMIIHRKIHMHNTACAYMYVCMYIYIYVRLFNMHILQIRIHIHIFNTYAYLCTCVFVHRNQVAPKLSQALRWSWTRHQWTGLWDSGWISTDSGYLCIWDFLKWGYPNSWMVYSGQSCNIYMSLNRGHISRL